MRQHHTAYTVAAMLTVALTITGCTRTDDHAPTSRATTTTQAPAAELADAANRLKNETFAMTMTVKLDDTDAELNGDMDPAHERGALTATTTVDGRRSVQEWRMIGNTVYLKSNTPTLPGTTSKPWRRIAPTGPDANLTDGLDGAKIADPLRQATAVHRTSTGHYTGTLQIAALTGFLDSPTSTSGPSGQPPQSLTFTAETDTQNRLTHYHLDVPRSRGGTYPIDITYSGFGVPVKVQAPPAEQVAD